MITEPWQVTSAPSPARPPSRPTGALPSGTDVAQLAFELIAFLEAANAMSLMHDDLTVYDRARTAIENRLR